MPQHRNNIAISRLQFEFSTVSKSLSVRDSQLGSCIPKALVIEELLQHFVYTVLFWLVVCNVLARIKVDTRAKVANLSVGMEMEQ